MTVLVLSSGRQVRVRYSAKQIRQRFRHPGYITVGKDMLRREQVALICVEHEVVEEKKRRILSPRLGIGRGDRQSYGTRPRRARRLSSEDQMSGFAGGGEEGSGSG